MPTSVLPYDVTTCSRPKRSRNAVARSGGHGTDQARRRALSASSGPRRLLEDEREHHAEQRGVGGVARPHPVEPGRGRESLLDPDARPDEEGAVDAHLGVDVEERQLGQVRVAGAQVEQLAVALREQVQEGVGEHGALRRARRAGGEVDRADVRGRRRSPAVARRARSSDANGTRREPRPGAARAHRRRPPCGGARAVRPRRRDRSRGARPRRSSTSAAAVFARCSRKCAAVVDVDRDLHGAEPGRAEPRRARTRRGCASSAARGRRARPRGARARPRRRRPRRPSSP